MCSCHVSVLISVSGPVADSDAGFRSFVPQTLSFSEMRSASGSFASDKTKKGENDSGSTAREDSAGNCQEQDHAVKCALQSGAIPTKMITY